MYTYIPSFWSSFPFSSSQGIEQSSLCYTVGSCQLSILYIISIVYTCQFQSPNLLPLPFLPLVSICLFSMPVSLFLLCKQVHLYLSSRFHIQASIYNIYFSLSDILHSVQQSLGPSMYLQRAQLCAFLWLSNIPLSMYHAVYCGKF